MVPGRTDRREGDWGDHKNSLPIIERVSGHILLCEEREGRGGGGVRRTETGKSRIRNKEIQDLRGGCYLLPGFPRHPPLPSTTSHTGRAGRALKHRDLGQEVSGGQPSI